MSKSELEKENEQLRKQIAQLEKQLFAIYKERDKNSDDKLVTEHQQALNKKINE